MAKVVLEDTMATVATEATEVAIMEATQKIIMKFHQQNQIIHVLAINIQVRLHKLLNPKMFEMKIEKIECYKKKQSGHITTLCDEKFNLNFVEKMSWKNLQKDEILQKVSKIKILDTWSTIQKLKKTGGKNHPNFQNLFLKIPE